MKLLLYCYKVTFLCLVILFALKSTLPGIPILLLLAYLCLSVAQLVKTLPAM